MERFAAYAVAALEKALKTPLTSTDLEVPHDPALGDFAFPCFKLAKQFRKNPQEVAKEVMEQVQATGALPAIFKLETKGAYVNFHVDAQAVARAVLGDIVKGDALGSYGAMPENTRGAWVLEYSSPNIAKPMNIYHLRPTALGACLDRVGRYRGFQVVSINHLGDWGTQYGKLAIAMQLFADELPAEPSIMDMVNIYVKFHALEESKPELAEQAREAVLKLERHDPEMVKFWTRCREIALAEFMRIYARLGVRFDHYWGESFYEAKLKPMLADLERQGLLVESEGARVVQVTDREGREIPPCILQRSDGGSLYATRDVCAALYRHEQFNFDRMTYIVGQEQKLHFQQVFGVLRKMGKEWESVCEHVPTGLYRFKGGKMSTRKGNFVTLEDVLEDAKTHVKMIIHSRMEKDGATVSFSATEIEDIAEKVAMGAVVFHDLHTDPARDVEFDLERVVDFDGETGPWLQYAHTRCLSVLRKSGVKDVSSLYSADRMNKLTHATEVTLIKTLGQFPLHLERTLKHSKASQLAHYLIDVVKAFGTFYRECHILVEDQELSHARLVLVEATRRVLGQGLSMLGVPLPEKM